MLEEGPLQSIWFPVGGVCPRVVCGFEFCYADDPTGRGRCDDEQYAVDDEHAVV